MKLPKPWLAAFGLAQFLAVLWACGYVVHRTDGEMPWTLFPCFGTLVVSILLGGYCVVESKLVDPL